MLASGLIREVYKDFVDVLMRFLSDPTAIDDREDNDEGRAKAQAMFMSYSWFERLLAVHEEELALALFSSYYQDIRRTVRAG